MKLVLVLLIAVLWSQLATTTIFKKKIFKHQPHLPPASYYRAAEAKQLTPSYSITGLAVGELGEGQEGGGRIAEQSLILPRSQYHHQLILTQQSKDYLLVGSVLSVNTDTTVQ